jgi:hypothetical protein
VRPTLGRVVIYTRVDHVGEEYTARITRVSPISLSPDELARGAAAVDGGISVKEFEAIRYHDEHAYNVWLAVDIHNDLRAETWFTPTPVRFNPNGAGLTWRWPDRV